MKVKDILRITNNRVYVMEQATCYSILAKFTDAEEQISTKYSRNDILQAKVIDIQSSGNDLILSV